MLSLALGIGANTAIFSVLHNVVLNALPYDDPERLMIVWETSADNARALGRARELRRLAARRAVVRVAGRVRRVRADARRATAKPQRLRALGVSGNFFTTLGARRAASAARCCRPTTSRMRPAWPF